MSEPTFQIPTDVIAPIIQAHVLTAVTGALGNHSQILNEVVARVLMQPTGEDGKPSTSSYRAKPFIEFLVSEALRNAVRAAVLEAVAAHQETVRLAVLKEMSRKNSPLVKQMVEGMLSGVFDPKRLVYSLKVNLAGES